MQNFTITVNQTAFTPITVSGVVYKDINGNGTRDVGDPALSGWTIQSATSTAALRRPPRRPTAAVRTASPTSGRAATGCARCRSPGWYQTSTNPADITATSGVNVPGVNFGDHSQAAPAVVGRDARQQPVRSTPTPAAGPAPAAPAGRAATAPSRPAAPAARTRCGGRPLLGVYEVFVSYPAAEHVYALTRSSTEVRRWRRLSMTGRTVPGYATYGGVSWASLGVFNFNVLRLSI